MAFRRPLPVPPGSSPFSSSQYTLSKPLDIYDPLPSPYSSPYSGPNDYYDKPPTTLPGGTLIHKGFYDLLSMIPTPNPSRLLWGAPSNEPVVAGPRYEELPSANALPPISPPLSPPPVKKGRRISKDMVSKPTGFVHLVHASDAYQAEELLTRWGPDGIGKLGDPRWANPIKDRIRQNNRARAVNEVVSALKPSTTTTTVDAGALGPLRVVNGMSTATSSSLTTAARENVPVSPAIDGISGLPAAGKPGNSTILWGGGLQPHAEVLEHSEHDFLVEKNSIPEQPPPRKPITPSLVTLEKAVAARIYFENLYFPLLRQTPSREQRRLAMERDMAQMNLNPGQKDELRARWRKNETDYLREQRRKVDVTAFVKLKTIGHGAFGVVSLVRERSTGHLYAMKQLRKTDMLRKGQEGHVRAERDILKSASLVSSPGGAEWIVKLYYSFQDRDNLYLVLEYMGGGDLLNLLIERDIFPEDFTRFYIAEMVLAIESCHKHGFIHRDIKPDNFLFDPEGHIKLSDFGLATDLHWAHDTSYYEQQRLHLLRKHGIDLEDSYGMSNGKKTKRMNRHDVEMLMGGGDGPEGLFTWREKHRRKLAYSVCGTNSYMSPEVIRGHGYSYSCDWWSLGVIMFECLYGYPPFVSKSRHETRQKILSWHLYLKFPSERRISREAVDLMRQLLCEPEDRLGSQASTSVFRPDSMVTQQRRSGFQAGGGSVDGAELIKAHPWFRGIDWYNIHRYPAPYCPELSFPEDTRHFDEDIEPEPLVPENGAHPDATRDPLLRDKVHGPHILNMRKALAFAGFTHKSPRAVSYVSLEKAFNPLPDTYGQDTVRGRPPSRLPPEASRGRAMSM